MRRADECTEWVVYRMTLYPGGYGGNVVCGRREWDALERARPGFHLLVRAGIGTEQEAEKLARGTAGDTPPRKLRQDSRTARARQEARTAAQRPQPAG
jgi:hypothetical protein